MQFNKVITKDLSNDIDYFFNIDRPMMLFLKQQNIDNLVGVEIGTYKGENAKRILDLLDITKLYCVDPWIDDEFKLNGEDIFNEAIQTLKQYDNKEIIRKYSYDALDDIPNDLDFVYIDGDHSYDGVTRDLELYYPKVKIGGIIGGHDFWSSEFGVVQAVLEFAEKHNLTINGDINDWWFVKSECEQMKDKTYCQTCKYFRFVPFLNSPKGETCKHPSNAIRRKRKNSHRAKAHTTIVGYLKASIVLNKNNNCKNYELVRDGGKKECGLVKSVGD